MAVVKKYPIKAVMAAFGVSGPEAAALVAAGASCMVTGKAVKFVYKGEVLSSAPVPSKVTIPAMQGCQPNVGHKAVVMKAVEEAASGLGPGAKSVLHSSVGSGGKGHEVTVDIKAGTPPTAKPVDAVVHLDQAGALYQKVRGTSPGSVYVVVAMGEGLKVAARYSANRLSIRAGGDVATHKTRFDNIGFSGGGSVEDGYLSMHVLVEDPVLAAKALGSVLVGLGVQFTTGVPDFSRVVA